MSGGEACILGLGNGALHLVPQALESTGGLEETQPYTCEENSWRLSECPTRPNTGGKLAVIRRLKAGLEPKRPGYKPLIICHTSLRQASQPSPLAHCFCLGSLLHPPYFSTVCSLCLPQSSDPSASAS